MAQHDSQRAFPVSAWTGWTLVFVLVGSRQVAAQEVPRAPAQLGAVEAEAIPGPGHNLIRNGSFEGSGKYSCQGGEWRPMRGRTTVDPTTAAVGKCSLRKAIIPLKAPWFNDAIEFAPILCRRDAVYCVSFFARADRPGAVVKSWVRGMHVSDNDKWDDYPHLSGSADLSTGWRRFSYLFRANRLPATAEVANSYFLTIVAQRCETFWVDGVQVEQVAEASAPPGRLPERLIGYPTPFRLHGPVEVCAEAINLPKDHLYSPDQRTAEVRAAVVNGPDPRLVKLRWDLMDHRQRSTGVVATAERQLQSNEVWSEVRPIPLDEPGAMVVRVTATDARTNARLATSDEPVTRLPFDHSAAGREFDQRFGINLSFSRPQVPTEANQGLHMLRRLGFRWVRIEAADWAAVEKQPGRRDWSDADADVAFASEHGFRCFVTVANAPAWAGGGKIPAVVPAGLPQDPDDPRWSQPERTSAFDTYLNELASRYRGRVDIYQIGNETTFDPPATLKSASVLQLCRRAAQILRGADPAVKIMGGNILYDWKVDYWRDVLKLGGATDIDYFGWDFDCYINSGTDLPSIHRLRTAVAENAGRSVPLFNYESGWGSGWMQDYAADPIGGARLDYGAIPDEMARTLVSLFAGGTTHFVLHLTAYPENLMGSYLSYTRWPTQIYDEQERPRVTLAAYSTLIHYLGLSDYLKPVTRQDWGVEGHAFFDRRTNRPLVACWSSWPSDRDRDLPLAPSSETLILSDVMGRERTVRRGQAAAFPVVLPANRAVMFVLGAPGTSAESLVEAFARLPIRTIHLPAVRSEEPKGSDRFGGKWQVGFGYKSDLASDATVRILAPTLRGQQFEPQQSTHAWAIVGGDGSKILLGSHGKAAEVGFDDTGILLFTPPQPGRYSLQGSARIGGGEQNRTRLCLGKIKADRRFELIGDVDIDKGSVDLATLAQRKGGIVLGANESLLIAGYRTAWHWYGVVELEDVRLEAVH